ncbi:KptA family-domain-containing protein [Roridomyces roridus]|uniref:2'-phosphotransferase n=1 Tax=Roridomyces roridus TaxID=1738132 RepID=A0AAD7BL29_9AGAR|nr:KptA family-domain-containing protein [Roridomyces roridus]
MRGSRLFCRLLSSKAPLLSTRAPPPHLAQLRPPLVFTSRQPSYPRAERTGRSVRDHAFFSKRLTWILRHGALELGLRIRPDGFVRASDLKNHPRFEYLGSLEFDEMFFKDLTRYTLLEEANVLWIRSNGHHTIKNVGVKSSRILTSQDLPEAVYPLTDAEWRTVEHHGIQRSHEDGFIHLVKPGPGEDFARGRGSVFDLCIYLNVPKMLSEGMRLFLSGTGTKTRVLTDGDENYVIPPRMFKRVVRVRVERENLLAE